MSGAEEVDRNLIMSVCANCNIPENDDVELKTCAGCKSVRYCSMKCQKEHRLEHKHACKIRAAELRDELLFKQPEGNHLGDCPICLLPLPFDPDKISVMVCCSKFVCKSCSYGDFNRMMLGSLDVVCSFCRKPKPRTDKEMNRYMEKRAKASDPHTLQYMGAVCFSEGNYEHAFMFTSRAAEFRNVEAIYDLSKFYRDGLVVEQDSKKEIRQLEEAAIGGHPEARHNLGCIEWEEGTKERAVKHLVIASKQGFAVSLDFLKEEYATSEGLVSKDDLVAALRGYQAAVDATKSKSREDADRRFRKYCEE